MKIQIHVNREAAIKAGHEQYGPQVVQLPLSALSPELRAELASCQEIDGITQVGAPVQVPIDHRWPVIEAATEEAVITLLQARIAWRQDYEAAKAREHAERLAEELVVRGEIQEALPALGAHVEACEASGSAEPLTVGRIGLVRDLRERFAPSWPGSAPGGPEREALQSLAKRLKVVAQTAERAAKAAAETAAAQVQEQRWAALRAWTQAHGSERARLLIEEGHAAWQAVSEQE